MTYNEFKFCCMMFTKAFEGKKYGEVVKECYFGDKDCIISFEKLSFFNNIFGYGEQDYLFEYNIKVLSIQNYDTPNTLFKTIKDFLNYFEIPFKDIV